MKMLTPLVLALVLAVGATPAFSAPQPATLITNVNVASDNVLLGDIFRGAGAAADRVVARAPQPGRRLVLDVAWLVDVARAYRVRWRPRSRFDRVIIMRDSQIIDAASIIAEIKVALKDRGVDDNMRIQFEGHSPVLYIAAEGPSTVTLRNFRLDHRTGRFAVTVLAPADVPTVQKHINGRLIEQVRIPVLNRKVAKGHIIRQGDTEWLELDAGRIKPNTITELDQLVGQAARSALNPGRPLHVRHVRKPVLVAKGSLVTIVLQVPRMRLTARGKVLENGSRGDTVRVMNIKSKRILVGVVSEAGTVRVGTADHLALN